MPTGYSGKQSSIALTMGVSFDDLQGYFGEADSSGNRECTAKCIIVSKHTKANGEFTESELTDTKPCVMHSSSSIEVYSTDNNYWLLTNALNNSPTISGSQIILPIPEDDSTIDMSESGNGKMIFEIYLEA